MPALKNSTLETASRNAMNALNRFKDRNFSPEEDGLDSDTSHIDQEQHASGRNQSNDSHSRIIRAGILRT